MRLRIEFGVERYKPVVIADKEVARANRLAAKHHRRVDGAALRRPWAARSDMTGKDREIRPLRQCRNVPDRAIANDADRPAPPRLSAQNLANHRRLGAPLSRDDQNVAGSDPVDCHENSPEVRRLAEDRDGAPKQARLLSGRHKGTDRRVNLPFGAPDIDRNSDGNFRQRSTSALVKSLEETLDSNSQG